MPKGLLLEEFETGVKIGGRNINNLQYADDTTLLSEIKEGLEHLIKKIKEESEKFSLFLNVRKTELIVSARNGDIRTVVDGGELECVQDFIFLRSLINQGGDCSQEIKHRNAPGRTAMTAINRIWKSKNVTLTTNCRLVRANVFLHSHLWL